MEGANSRSLDKIHEPVGSHHWGLANTYTGENKNIFTQICLSGHDSLTMAQEKWETTW